MSGIFQKLGLGKVKLTTPAPPLAGVALAVKAATDSSVQVRSTIFDEFSMKEKIVVITGGGGGLGLEMGMSLCEAGAKAIYCIDISPQETTEFKAAATMAAKLGSSMKYIISDVTVPSDIGPKIAEIADRHQRLDVLIAAAGILGIAEGVDCTEYPADMFKKVMDINTNGVFFSSQAAAKAMVKFGTRGSIIMIASMSGSVVNRSERWVPYNASKAAVVQMAKNMACELGENGIRVNSISPGHIYTKMTAAAIDKDPSKMEQWSNLNPLNRLGQIHEVRGICLWLSSDASTYVTGSDVKIDGGHTAW